MRVVVVTGSRRSFCVGGDRDALAGHAERGGYDAGLPAEVGQPGLRRAARARPRLRLALRPAPARHRRRERRAAPASAWRSPASATCGSRRGRQAHHRRAQAGPAGRVRDCRGCCPGWSASPAPPTCCCRAGSCGAETRPGAMERCRRRRAGGRARRRVGAAARRLATGVSPGRVAVTKRQLYDDLLGHDVGASVEHSKRLLDQMMRGAEYREGVAALRERRPPRFTSGGLAAVRRPSPTG